MAQAWFSASSVVSEWSEATQPPEVFNLVGLWRPAGRLLQQLQTIKQVLIEQHTNGVLLQRYDPAQSIPGKDVVVLSELLKLQADGLAEALPPRGVSTSSVWRATQQPTNFKKARRGRSR